MSVKLTDLAKNLGLSSSELRAKIKELGFDVKSQARTVEDDVAAKLTESVQASQSDESLEDVVEIAKPSGTVDIYEEVIEKELDKEIIKSQRKMTAGKDVHKVKKPVTSDASQSSAKAPQGASDTIEIPETITVKEFCEKTTLSPVRVIGELMKNGILANINQTIDYETASILADDFGIHLRRKRTEAAIEDISGGNLEALLEEKDDADLIVRPPVVTIMGHVDHGKTSLLDAIRETSVASTEAGGITQHIGAYQVEKNGRKITFIDTPGHEAFTAMRARGAKVTDIVILVVAADEGVKPQTIEALHHAEEAHVPIMVAINKIDKEGANPDRVKAQLAELGLQPEEWGGKTIMAPVSAFSGEGIATLLEMIILVADVENLRANPNRPAVATILESHLNKSLGPVATVVVNTGTLHLQDSVVVGSICGRVKTMKDHLGRNLKEAPPSTPVQIAGIEATPQSGDVLQVVGSMEEARRKADQIKLHRTLGTSTETPAGLDLIMSAIQAGQLKTLKVILKADTLGSLEAIKLSLTQVKKDEVSIKLIHSAVGTITESDVMMAAASQGIVIGFNTEANVHVREAAHRTGVQIFTYQIIYKMIDDLKKILSGLLEPEVQQVILGRAEVRMVFMSAKKYMIVGCKVISGKVENKSRIRVFRGEEMIGEGVIASLKRINDPVHELGEGNDCGIKFEGDVKLEEKDILESWKDERRNRIVT